MACQLWPGWTFAIWLCVFIFNFRFSIELRLPCGRFSNSLSSAILVRWWGNLNNKAYTLNRITRTLLVSLFGLTIFYREVSQIDNTDVFDDMINIGLEIIALLIFSWVIYRDRKQYLSDKIWTAFLSTIIGIITILGLITTLFIYNLRDKSPVKFSCVSKIVDFNGVRIDFREDGTYKLDNFCMGSNFFRGKYTIKDSTITLDKMNIDKVIESNKLVIRADGEKDSLGNIEKSIYQIDSHGKIIGGATDFRLFKSNN